MKTSPSLINAAAFVVVLLTCSFAPPLPAQLIQPAPYIVAQDDYGGENGNFGGTIRGEPYAQTFTATSGGILSSIAGGFVVPYTPSDPYYIFQFRNTTAGGLPGTQVIASVNVPTAILSQSVGGGFALINLSADFSSFGISLSAGHQYAISIDVSGTFGTTTDNDFFWGLTGTPYNGGAVYYLPPGGPQLLSNSENLLFTIEAVAAPEPSIWALAAILCAWNLRPRWLRQYQSQPAIDKH
jgi:hypothetical protein